MRNSVMNWLAAAAVAVMVLPVHAFSDVTTPARPAVKDIQLTAAGAFAGVVVTEDGTAAANVPVQVMHGNNVVAEVRTDRDGRYSVQGVRTGVHVIRTVNNQQPCRFWAQNSAPPSAKSGLVLTARTTVIRGQNGCGDCGSEPCQFYGCGEGCGEGCGGRGHRGGCLTGGFGGVGGLLVVGAFGAVTAVTIHSATKDDSSSSSVPPPASP